MKEFLIFNLLSCFRMSAKLKFQIVIPQIFFKVERNQKIIQNPCIETEHLAYFMISKIFFYNFSNLKSIIGWHFEARWRMNMANKCGWDLGKWRTRRFVKLKSFAVLKYECNRMTKESDTYRVAELKHPYSDLTIYWTIQCIIFNFCSSTIQDKEKCITLKIITEIIDRWRYTTGYMLKKQVVRTVYLNAPTIHVTRTL